MSNQTQIFMPIKLFYCYAREDQPLRDELDSHLRSLGRASFITSWHDGELLPGTSWEREISAHIETADVILLLVSAAFFKSDYCYSTEMQRAIDRHHAQQACVLPILIRPVHWEDAPFAELQLLPDNANPITSWHNRDEAFVNVVKGIRRVINDLRAQRMMIQQIGSNPVGLSTDKKQHPHRKPNRSFLGAILNDLFRRRLSRSSILAQEIERIEAAEATAQWTWAQHNQISAPPPVLIQQQAIQDKTLVYQPPRAFCCPSCGEVVMPDAKYCPNCRQILSPTESGLHKHVRLPASPAQSSSSANLYANSQSRPVPPPPSSMTRVSSLADQPTLAPLTLSVAPPPEMTLPAKRLGFLVGTRSDPGIKRKYKPNEDSLLAARGLVTMTVTQPFGLFVVADGMGGYANGQDASRLAIQMIVENVLPKLVTDTTGSLDFAKVLVDGIQSANQAVYQQNIDNHTDMGTTITSALVVGNIAYVVNAGDSRTYLYRDNKGLQKVTNDHSVVASLVEAGIIKPDDIYTHPKRNQIYRSLGEKANVEVDEFTIQLRQGDKLLLCSDGLWDMVRDPKIEDVIKQPVPDPSMTGDALIQSALEGGGEDNVTVIVVQMTEGRNIDAHPRLKVLAKPDTVQLPEF